LTCKASATPTEVTARGQGQGSASWRRVPRGDHSPNLTVRRKLSRQLRPINSTRAPAVVLKTACQPPVRPASALAATWGGAKWRPGSANASLPHPGGRPRARRGPQPRSKNPAGPSLTGPGPKALGTALGAPPPNPPVSTQVGTSGPAHARSTTRAFREAHPAMVWIGTEPSG